MSETKERRLSTLVQIDGNIEIPVLLRKGRPPRWPIRSMKVGDSFFTMDRNAKQVVSYAKKKGIGKFIARLVNEEDVKGYRVWRVE